MTKPAFMIFGLDIHDAEKFGEYAAGAGPLLPKFGTQLLSATNDIERLHGAWNRQRVTVLKFPSKEQAMAMWNSPDYAPWKALRESCSSADIILLEGPADEDADTPAPADTCHYVLGRNDMLNADWVPEYQAKVPPIAAKYSVSMPCFGPDFEVLDGEFNRESVVLLQFPSEEAYRGFWFGDDYAEIKKLREDNTEADHIAFAGGFDGG